MKSYGVLLLVCLLCMVVIPAMTVSADEYMGEGIQLGGSGTMVTRVTTAPTTAAATVPPLVNAATGSLAVTTTPAGASVFVDGVQQGISPATISGLSPGSHTLLIRMYGYVDNMAPVTIITGQTQAYTATLVPAVTQLPALPAPTRSPGFGVIYTVAALGAVLSVRIGRHG